MARFAVYRHRRDDLLLIDCQADRLSYLPTRFVVPLLPRPGVPSIVPGLHPIVDIGGIEMVMATQLAAAVTVQELGKRVLMLDDDDHRIVRALDTLIGTA